MMETPLIDQWDNKRKDDCAMVHNSALFKDDRVRNQKFCFECRPDLPCFNKCCRDVYIILSPYDVLRLKKALRLSSGEFLEKYTTPVPTGTALPLVALQMRGAELECPFVTDRGCSVYDVRPWSCRLAPVDVDRDGRIRFIFESDFCLGRREKREWTLGKWMRDQGIDDYEEIEGLLGEVPSRIRFTGMERLDAHLGKLVHMVCYDPDRFRRYVFETGFLELYPVEEGRQQRLREDDRALLRFGLEWLMTGPELKDTIRFREELDR